MVIFSQNIVELIKKRSSWRTYSKTVLDLEIIKKLNKILSDIEPISPFNSDLNKKINFQLLDINEIINKKKDMENIKKLKLGTYGFIKNAQFFIAGTTERFENSWENYGYLFELIILKATEMELGTCWLGGTFSRKSFSNLLQINGKREIIPAITPVGYIKDQRRFKEKVIRFAIRAKKRYPWNKLFFEGDFQNQLKKENAGKFAESLEMIRLGPSASNLQPWRIIKEKKKNIFHFYIELSKRSLYRKMQRLDIGIAVCHFDLVNEFRGNSGFWEIKMPDIEIGRKNLIYKISWKEKQSSKK